ncbi:NAD(P)-binding protein-16 [Coleophoma crateriformis]|uniref:NAD(P)-binding protein-16 n=1 Tax=Coleophoma crateriformis TaxID=565419 RepID=A0A3D8SMF1_9HELO|nr:NAD(P)-binding protein-16 [Coleophoma crateriformis]
MSSAKTIVLITGANGGIGFETAAAIGALSAKYHVLVGSRTASKGEQAVAELQARSPQATYSALQLDVTSDDSITAAAAAVEQEFHKLDVLINNAGVIVSANLPLREQLRATFETNSIGPAVMIQTFLPLLRKSKDPRIINVSSDLGSITLKTQKDPSWWSNFVIEEPYRMSKAALNMLTGSASVELGKEGIKVFGVCPGYVVTNLSGTGEKGREQRVQNGAGDPAVSGQTIASIVDGKRDSDVGRVVHKDGVYPW